MAISISLVFLSFSIEIYKSYVKVNKIFVTNFDVLTTCNFQNFFKTCNKRSIFIRFALCQFNITVYLAFSHVLLEIEILKKCLQRIN